MKRWQMVVVALLLVSSGLVSRGVSRAERGSPVRIGVLTASWGSTSKLGLTIPPEVLYQADRVVR